MLESIYYMTFKGAVGGRGRDGMWRSYYLFLKKSITLVIFRGGGVRSHEPHLSMDI